MAAYIIARIQVTDPDQYKSYQALSPGAVEKAGGRFLVRGGQSETLEGSEENQRLVILEFENMERARAFYVSKDYQEARLERLGAADAQFVAVEGV